ncbi:PREDICTED: probable serine/threonine-protein kinase tsuA [Rhagoletis zephyria]|uniref:probable serine/threonine-protein kinase tsuA n=1 Tax=Rhagoletis zephyria TaxID=28612 RepID=UPI0008118059|nr:PREDICTED: probable serine/threonine-protein kinase tsuA [Rhagoletis zephyria]
MAPASSAAVNSNGLFKVPAAPPPPPPPRPPQPVHTASSVAKSAKVGKQHVVPAARPPTITNNKTPANAAATRGPKYKRNPMFLQLMDFMGTAPATESKCMEQVLLLLRLFINCGKLPDSTLKKGFEFLGRPLAPCVRQAGDTDQCSRITIYCRCVAIRTLAAMKSIVIGPATDPTTLAGSSQRFLVDSTLAEHRVLVGPQSKAFFWEKKAKEVAFHLRSLYRVEVEVENETADEVEMDNAAVESQNEPSLKQQQQKGSSFESSSFFSPSFASSSSVAVDISLVKNPQPELGVGVNYMDMDCGAGEFNSYSDNDDDGDNNNNNFVRRLDPFLLPSTDQLQKANKKMHFCGENASSQDTSAVPLNNGGNMDIEDDDDEPIRFVAQGLKQQKKQQKLKHLNDIRELEQQQNLEHSAKQVIKTGNQATSNYVPKFDFFGPLSAVKKAKKYLGMEKVRKIEQEERENSERKRKEDELAKQASKKLMKTSSAKSPAQTPVLATGGEVKQSRLPESAKHSVSNNTSASGSPSPLPSTPVPPVQRTSLKLRLRKMISSDGNDEVYSSEHIENLSYVAKSADDYNKETKVRTEAVTASTEKKSKCYRKVDLSQHNTASAKVPLTTTIKRVYDSDDNDDPDKPDDNDNNINADDNETVDTGDSFSKSSANDFASTSVDNAASITETAAKSADAENANAKLLANELVSTEISVFHSASTSADNATSSFVVKNADANSGEKKVATNDNETSQFPKTQPSTSTSADDQVLNTTATKNKNGLLTSEEGAANNAPVQKRKRGRPRKDEQTKAADLQKRQQAKAEAEIAAATATDSTEAAVDPNRRMSARRKAVPEKAVSEMVKPTTPKTTPSFTSTVTSAPAVDGVVLVKRKRGRPPKYPRPEVPQPVAKTAIESQVESTPASAETAASEGDLAEKLNESEGQLDKLQKLPVSAAEDDVAEKVNSSKEQAKSAAVSEQTAENDAVEKLNSSEEVKLESKMPARNTTTDDDVAVASEKLLSSTKSTAPSKSPPTLEPVVASSTKFYCLGSAKKQWLSSTLQNLNEIEVSESDHDSQQSQATESVAITTIRKSLRKKASRQFSSAEKQSKPLEVLSDDVQTDQPTTSTAVNEKEIVKEAVVEKEVVEQNVNDKPEREFLEICSNEVEQVAGGESPKTAKVAAPLTEKNDNVTQSNQGERANENLVSAKRKSPESDAESDASLSFSTRRSLRSVKSTDYRSMNNGQLSSFPEKEYHVAQAHPFEAPFEPCRSGSLEVFLVS